MRRSLSYKGAGVDIDADNRLVDKIKPIAERTWHVGMLAGPGRFGGLFELPVEHYTHPVLVSATDGADMVICTAPADAAQTLEVFAESSEKSWPMGKVAENEGTPRVELTEG